MRVVLLAVSAAVAGAVVALPSCTGLPGKTCFADRVSAFGVTEDAGPDKTCTSCLQTKNAPKACCDAVGACDEDPDKQCVPSFQAAHACVVAGGPSEEPRCKGLLTNDKSRALYACMRSTCGPECGVPSCDLDPAVVLFANPACDRCMGGACCEPINACYANRRCKLALECITEHCKNTLGPSMTDLTASGADGIRALAEAACAAGAPPAPAASEPSACIARCLDDFAPRSGESGGTGDDQSARCLAVEVVACGARASCGPACARPDAGPYSSDEEWPEDRPPAADASVTDARAP